MFEFLTVVKFVCASGTSNTTVKKQLAHVLYEVMQIAKRDPKEYSHYFSDDEMIRINDVCKGRWYNMTCDAVTEVYFKVCLIIVIGLIAYC